MLRQLLAVVLFSFVLSGCAITQTIDAQKKADIDLINQRLNTRPATLYLRGDSLSHGHTLQLQHDSTFWIEQGTLRSRMVATDDIYAIEAAVFRSPILYRKSFAVGFATGYVTMAALQLSKDDPARISTQNVALTLGISVLTGVLGSVIFRSYPASNRAVGKFILHERP